MEHAGVAELERHLESARRESWDRATEVTVVRAEEQHIAERGLEAAKDRHVEAEARLWKSLANTDAVLQKSLEALKSEQDALVSERNALESARKALESERKAQSEVDQEVLVLRGRPVFELAALLSELGGKVKSLERDLETVKVTFGWNAEELAKSHEEQHALEGELDQIRNVT
ncbi:uncharacterized protein [Miscanthus floridulus]|uniref:uncharacterized protein n=1 Tax=Miscanthus floridulus TaxID=154761 RepID=UPI00345A22B3